MERALHELGLREAAALIRSGKLRPSELLDAYLARIAAVDEQVRGYLLVLEGDARAAAARADAEIAAGRWRGPLHGLPYAVKDNYHAAGHRTCAGSRLMLDRVSTENAAAIDRLEDAGAILLGKLNTWEYGTGNASVAFDLPYPPARNPWKLDRFTGGSSSGSGAAVAAGTALFALGTDTGGSVRLPAAGCGAQGIKPTLGRISRRGIVPNCFSFDTPGILARSVEDCAAVLRCLAGPDARDPMCARVPGENYEAGLGLGAAGLRVGYLKDFGGDAALLDAEMGAAVENGLRALEKAGAVLVPVELPLAPAAYRSVSTIINWSESYAIHEKDFQERRHLMGRALHEKMLRGAALGARDYLNAQRRRRDLVARTDAAMAGVDVLAMPTIYRPAPDIRDDARVRAFTAESGTHVWSLTGHPAATVRAGFSASGLPLAMQFAGGFFREALVLRAAAAYEALSPDRERRAILVPAPTAEQGFAHTVPEASARPLPPSDPEALMRGAREAAARLDRPASEDAEPMDPYFLTGGWHGD